MFLTIKICCTLIGLVLAVVWDLKTRRIPNWIILFLLGSALILNFTEGSVWGRSGAGFALGLALLFIPFALGGMGAGDVKFLAGIGALWGPKFVLATALIGAVVGGIIALGYLLAAPIGRAISARNLWLVFMIPKEELRKLGQKRFPYSLAIALGAVGAYFFLGG